MKNKIFIVLLALCGVVSAEGVYIDGNVGVTTTQSMTTAYNLNAGYMFGNYIGAEGGYTGGSGFNIWDAAVKGVVPFPLLDIYGKFGLAYQDSFSSSNMGVLYGAGVSFPILPHLRLNIEDYAVSGGVTQNFLMGGVQFKF